jgi:hypothetical protein
MWDTSCPDWEDRILTGQPLVPPLPLIREDAALGPRNFTRLRQPDLHGKPRLRRRRPMDLSDRRGPLRLLRFGNAAPNDSGILPVIPFPVD